MKETEANMRNLKRFLAMALTMLMLVTSLSIVTSAKFEDVTDFQNEIAVLAQLGVIKGKADGTFGFDEPVTRRQTALFFARATTGKVDDALHWQSKVNTTPFKDLDPENDYYGAISYCHNNGIVKGRSTTEFAPNDNITFKEAITMAVRALGYKGADMDAAYPWAYYSKAVTLGLDKGIEDVGLDDVVTRGVMAKLIYNMMFATNSEGTTIAAKAFGSAVKTTVLVLVAAKGKTLVKNLDTSVESNSKLAAFVELNDDGTFNYDKVYHFDWATFAELAYGEGNEEKAVDHVGYSYTVVTLDNLKSLVTVSENPVKKLTSA
ncbi:MAG TPA: S-layer homology domain-containing protein, partial [Bacillota bacterium]|nr:S-layer homology domain-containing protein [Bacillota bacterium]